MGYVIVGSISILDGVSEMFLFNNIIFRLV